MAVWNGGGAPGLLLNGPSSEGGLVKVDQRLVFSKDVAQSYSKDAAVGIKLRSILERLPVHDLGESLANAVTLVEGLESGLRNADAPEALNSFAALGNGEGRPLTEEIGGEEALLNSVGDDLVAALAFEHVFEAAAKSMEAAKCVRYGVRSNVKALGDLSVPEHGSTKVSKRAVAEGNNGSAISRCQALRWLPEWVSRTRVVPELDLLSLGLPSGLELRSLEKVGGVKAAAAAVNVAKHFGAADIFVIIISDFHYHRFLASLTSSVLDTVDGDLLLTENYSFNDY